MLRNDCQCAQAHPGANRPLCGAKLRDTTSSHSIYPVRNSRIIEKKWEPKKSAIVRICFEVKASEGRTAGGYTLGINKYVSFHSFEKQPSPAYHLQSPRHPAHDPPKGFRRLCAVFRFFYEPTIVPFREWKTAGLGSGIFVI